MNWLLVLLFIYFSSDLLSEGVSISNNPSNTASILFLVCCLLMNLGVVTAFDKYLSKSTSELINEYNESYNSQYVYYYDNSSFAKVDLYKEIVRDSSLSLKIIRNDTCDVTYKSMIRNESLNKVLEITDETTLDDIKTFIN